MNRIVVLMLTSLALSATAEEFSSLSEDEINKKLYSAAPLVSDLIRGARCAGIGVFLNEPSTNAPAVDILVQEWWTSPLTNSVVQIHELDPYSTNWVFPTNVPVVFFALSKRQMYSGHTAWVNPDPYPPEWVYSITNAEESAKLMFLDVDRAWFRTTRDNGLVHAFATNLWNCMRTNPNPTNYYEVLRDTERTVPDQASWRVNFDSGKTLSWIIRGADENGLVAMLNDPLLSPPMKGVVRTTLYNNHGWRYVNGVLTPPQ